MTSMQITVPTTVPLPSRGDLRRRDGDAIVTGAATYLDDIEPAGTLHCAILRSTSPAGRITRIDTSRLAEVAGVRAVLTAAEAREKSPRRRSPPLESKAPGKAESAGHWPPSPERSTTHQVPSESK
jgi:CO/xanthine dehydrogenase Mo-binding subunit